jgi:uncharacterized membrane protein
MVKHEYGFNILFFNLNGDDMTMQKKLLNIILVLSILLNMFFFGIMAAKFFDLRPPFLVPPSPISILKHAARGLSPESQQRVDIIIKKHEAVFDKGISEASTFFSQIQTVLTAEKFDRTALDALHHNMQRSDSVLQNEMVMMVSEIAETLTTAERQQFFEFLSHIPFPEIKTATEK